MKKYIIDFNDLFTKDIKQLQVPKDMMFYVLADEQANVPVTLLSYVQTFLSQITFVPLNETLDKTDMKHLLLGYLCGTIGKNDEICVVTNKSFVLPDELKELFPNLKFSIISNINSIKSKPQRTRQPKSKTISVPKTDELLAKPSITTPVTNSEPEKPVAVTQKQPIETTLTNDINTISTNTQETLLTELKKIDNVYPFEGLEANIAKSLRQSFDAQITFELQLRLNCGKDVAGEIFELLKPHFNRLKELVNSSENNQ